MKTIFRHVLLATMGLSFAPLGLAEEENIDHKIVDTEIRSPIPYQPFPMVNPETGERYHPNDEITYEDNGNTVTIRAEDFFRELNKVEQDLNLWGYSLRSEGGSLGTIKELFVNREKAKGKLSDLKKAHRDKKNKENPLEEASDFMDNLDKAWEKYDIPSLDDLYRHAQDEGYEVPLPEVPLFPTPSVTFEEGLAITVDWYLNNEDWMNKITSGDYRQYYERHYGK